MAKRKIKDNKSEPLVKLSDPRISIRNPQYIEGSSYMVSKYFTYTREQALELIGELFVAINKIAR